MSSSTISLRQVSYISSFDMSKHQTPPPYSAYVTNGIVFPSIGFSPVPPRHLGLVFGTYMGYFSVAYSMDGELDFIIFYFLIFFIPYRTNVIPHHFNVTEYLLDKIS